MFAYWTFDRASMPTENDVSVVELPGLNGYSPGACCGARRTAALRGAAKRHPVTATGG